MGVDVRALTAEIEGCIASQRALDDHLESVADLDPGRPSALPGWSIGHVLTHVARNADSHREMLDGRPQYVDAEARDGAIEEGSSRSIDVIIDDVRTSSDALASAWGASLGAEDVARNWSGSATTLSGARPLAVLPLLRWREVEIHRLDLGIGYRLADLDRHYLRCDLRMLEMLWRARRPIGLTPLPTAVLSTPPPERLMWFLGRGSIEGVGPVD